MDELLPHGRPGQPVCCASCDHTFEQDPPFFVECPTCHAKAGSYCKRPSGHSGPLVAFHAARDISALLKGYYDHTGNPGCGPTSDSPKAQAIIAAFHLDPAELTAPDTQLPLEF